MRLGNYGVTVKKAGNKVNCVLRYLRNDMVVNIAQCKQEIINDAVNLSFAVIFRDL